ncbi:MAG: hypothetical protein Kow0047_00040 [Anaerolineae bacterium]
MVARVPEAFRQRVLAFLQAHTTLTLATVAEDGSPQAAAVFFAFDEDLRLYFLSEPSSRHAQNLTRSPRVAVTIQDDGQDWREIQGLQLEGEASLVSDPRAQARAARIYGQRFGFVGELLRGTGEGALALVGPLARSRFYVISPTWIRLIDNRVRFGYKEEWRAES